MKTLFALELKKLTKKRMNIIVITVCLILAGILFYLPVSQFIVLDTDGKQTSGMEAIAMDKEFSNSNAGKLTNEKIKADIAKYQALFDDPENVSKDATQKSLNDSAYFKYFFPYSDYWKLINGNYAAPYAYDSSFSAITNMDLENNFDFYATRDEKVETLLNQEYDDWNFSDSEKTFWLNRVSSVSTPYEYSYHTGWETLLSCLELFVIGIIGICICVAGTFSGEYQSGADSIDQLGTFYLPVRENTSEPFRYIVQGDSFMGVTTHSQSPELAKAFVEWFYSEAWYPDYLNFVTSASAMTNFPKEKDPILAESDALQPDGEMVMYDGGGDDFTAIQNETAFDYKKLGAQMFTDGFDLDAALAELDSKWTAARSKLGIQ